MPQYTYGDLLSAHTILVHFFFDNRLFVCQIFKSYYILHCAQATVSFILILCSVQYLVPRFFIMTLSKPKLWSSLMWSCAHRYHKHFTGIWCNYDNANSRLLQNNGTYLPNNVASHSGRQSSAREYNFKCKENKESESTVNGNVWQIITSARN